MDCNYILNASCNELIRKQQSITDVLSFEDFNYVLTNYLDSDLEVVAKFYEQHPELMTVDDEFIPGIDEVEEEGSVDYEPLREPLHFVESIDDYD